MTIISAKTYRVDGNRNELQHVIETNDHLNQYGHLVTDQLIIEGGPMNWFVAFQFDNGSHFKTFDHMDRKVWKAIWSEYRQLSYEDWEPEISAEDLTEWQAASAGLDYWWGAR